MSTVQKSLVVVIALFVTCAAFICGFASGLYFEKRTEEDCPDCALMLEPVA